MEQFLQETLNQIREPDREAIAQALARQESLAKPPHSLGKLEDISVKLAGMTGKLYNPVDRRRVLIFASDNGIVEDPENPNTGGGGNPSGGSEED